MNIKNTLTIFLIVVTCLQGYYINHLRKELLAKNSSEFTNLHTKKHTAGFSFFRNYEDEPLTDTIGGTLPVSTSLADSARAIYKDHPNHLTILNGSSRETLEGFIIRKDRLIASTLYVPSDYIYLAFGVKPNQINDPDSLQDFTLYLYGMDSNKNVLKNRGKAIVYEYLTPCPQQCPLF